jgi:hypothetical protein
MKERARLGSEKNMNTNSFMHSAHGHGAAAAAPARQVEKFQSEPSAPSRRSGYGLPCAKCKTYYAADLAICPVCKNPQRVSPVEPLTTVAPAEHLPDPEQLEQERERFLREFNAQVMAAPLPPDSATPALHCNRQENHTNSPVPASICQSCFDQLQERLDVLEAAMHMDLREAAQVIYDAVWADPSDPSKTYQNAAQALLIELRRRSAIPQNFGQLQPPVN